MQIKLDGRGIPKHTSFFRKTTSLSNHGFRVKVEATEAGKTHPVLAGVGEITTHKLDQAGPLPQTTVILQNGTLEGKNDSTNPVSFVNEYKGGRVFYTSLGVPESFADEDFTRMLDNAIFWTAHKDPATYRR